MRLQYLSNIIVAVTLFPYLCGCTTNDNSSQGQPSPKQPSFVCTDKVENCGCKGLGTYLLQASLGLSPQENLTTVGDYHSIFSYVSEKAAENGTLIERCPVPQLLDKLENDKVGPGILSVLVHRNGHLYCLLGTSEISNIRLYQLVHNQSELWLLSGQHLESADFAEAWVLPKTASSVPFTLGQSHITADKIYHNFGEVKPSQDLPCSFTIKNTGQNTVILNRPESSCSCVVAADAKKTQRLLPNETHTIKLIAKTGQKAIGQQQVIVRCFEEGTGKMVVFPFFVFCTQREVLFVSPSVLKVAVSDKMDKFNNTLFLHEADTDRFGIADITADGIKDFSYAIEPNSNQSGLLTYKVTLSGVPDSDALRSGGNIHIHTTSAFTPLVKVPVYFSNTNRTETFPESVSFGTVKSGESCTKTVQIKSDKQKITVQKISEPKYIACRQRRQQDGTYELTLIFTPDKSGIWQDILALTLSTENGTKEYPVRLVAFVR